MKRFLCIIIFLFIAGLSFAEDAFITLLPWNYTKKEVMNDFMAKGWSTRADDFLHFYPVNQNIYYHNKLIKVKEVYFSFNDDGSVQSQNISLDTNYTLSVAFMGLMSVLIGDSTILSAQNYEKENDIDYFTYDGQLLDCDSHYVIMGKEDFYMLFLSYRSFR